MRCHREHSSGYRSPAATVKAIRGFFGEAIVGNAVHQEQSSVNALRKALAGRTCSALHERDAVAETDSTGKLEKLADGSISKEENPNDRSVSADGQLSHFDSSISREDHVLERSRQPCDEGLRGTRAESNTARVRPSVRMFRIPWPQLRNWRRYFALQQSDFHLVESASIPRSAKELICYHGSRLRRRNLSDMTVLQFRAGAPRLALGCFLADRHRRPNSRFRSLNHWR